MRPETASSALLDIAQKTLSEVLLPHLQGEQRYAAMMIGSAMRMVAREIAQADAMAQSSEALADAVPSRDFGTLVRAIRHGQFDAAPVLHAKLWTDAVVRTSVSKPSALARVEKRLAGIPGDDLGSAS